jgi:hypothetical protein
VKTVAQDQLNVKISFRDEPREQVRAALEDVGATEVHEIPQLGMIGIDDVIMVALALSALVGLIAKIIRIWSCGVVVDARGEKVLIKKECDLPRGTVLVIAKDGTKSTLHEPAEAVISEIIKKSGLAAAS